MVQQHSAKEVSPAITSPITASSPCFAVIIANPTSGSYIHHARQIEEHVSFLRNTGWRVELRLTKAAGDARRIACQAVAEKADMVIAAGGDGTINEVIQELVGSETALGVLPIGTVNVWAREMNIPLDVARARDVLLHGKTRVIDVGKVNDRYFLLMVGIGFDAEVTHAVEKKPMKRLGVIGYLLTGFWMNLGYENFAATLQFAGREVKTRAIQIVIGNTQLYGGAVKFTWQARCDDGLLDICIVRKRSKLRRLLVLLDFLLHREQRRQWVHYETCDQIEIATSKPIAMQVDGDPIGHTPAVFTIVPRALKVIVPQQTPEGLFSQP
jgi:diacylglycerol kinase (ATP)